MTVNCLSCGHQVDLGGSYGEYEGQIKCFACEALLEIKTEGGNLRSVRFLRFARRGTGAEAEAPAEG